MGKYKSWLILSFCAALFLFAGCKARKVLTTRVDSAATTTTVVKSETQSSHIDTGKTSQSKVKDTKKAIVLKDSSGIKTIIIPVPGTTSTVDAHGTFRGQASSVTTERKGVKSKTIDIDTKLQENAGEIKGVSDFKKDIGSDSATQQVVVHKKIKSVDAKPDYSWIWWVGAGVVVVLLIWYLYKKFF